jgi:hypothetical protein
MSELLKRATDYVISGTGLDSVVRTTVGLKLPHANPDDEKRCRQIDQIMGMLTTYIGTENPRRPFSIAVFGPPGSGKSTFVEEITRTLPKCKLVDTANLTQLSGPADLVRVFSTALDGQPNQESQTPVFFFDEFDTTLNDAPFGWLRWFLGPMQDGKFREDVGERKIGKAIFFFAGGTAETLDEFDQRARVDPGAYRARKVPDFISRLRGTIEIGGINGLGEARIVPRALVLRRLLQDRKGASFPDHQISQFLSDGHYVHGVRSMEAMLDSRDPEQKKFTLPDDVRRQHFSRGVLDNMLVGISAGLEENPAAPGFFLALTTELLRNGARLAYGGAFRPDGTLGQVVQAASAAPPELGAAATRSNPSRVVNYLGFPATLAPKINNSTGGTADVLRYIELQSLDAKERQLLQAPADQWFSALPTEPDAFYNPTHHAAWALSLFRMRLRMIQDISALIVLGGKDDGRSWGRFPGIAEEVMIAIALRKPVYVLGGAGGAAHATGQLLGLGATTPDPRHCLSPSRHTGLAKVMQDHDLRFEIPGEQESPADLNHLRSFLYHRGVTTSAWSWNGLALSENRQLFETALTAGADRADRAIGLVVKGLSRIGWKS